MQKSDLRQTKLIPITQIKVLNPRTRNRIQHKEIVDNIDAIGLKRPITVSRRPSINGEEQYDLVCGQGRLEAFRLLNQTEIPALVIDAAEEDCLIMSLVENIARHQQSSIELMREVEHLHKRGYSDAQIGRKIGVTGSWVRMIIGLLEKGEDRLITAVEKGILPISLAAEIARSDDAGVQQALADAYEKNLLKGRKLTAVRHLIERRATHGKKLGKISGAAGSQKKLTAEDLMRVYQREAEKQKLLIRKVEFTQSRLLFIVEAFKDLLSNEEFVKLLKLQKLNTMPRILNDRMQESMAP